MVAMAIMVMHRDNGEPSDYIFRVRHGDDVSDELLDIHAINAILEEAPHPKLREWIAERMGSSGGEFAGQLDESEWMRELPYQKERLTKAINERVDAQMEHNEANEHAERISTIVVLIDALQTSGLADEYPGKYEMLVRGLSEASLATIRDWEVNWTFSKVNADLAGKVHDKLRQDRNGLEAAKAKNGSALNGIRATHKDGPWRN